jgi:ubiquitin C-terminal hydrolase
MADNELERRCEKCQHDVASVEHRVVEMPRVLILHLKRFQVNADSTSYDKLTSAVNIIKDLDIGKSLRC